MSALARKQGQGTLARMTSASVIALVVALAPTGPVSGQAANPCAPKAANPLNPCSPGHIKAADAVHGLNPKAAKKAYDGLRKDLVAAFALTDDPDAQKYQTWKRYNSAPYESTQHGDRYLNNYANKKAQAYVMYENSGVMPIGSVLAKDSFTVLKGGEVYPGPLFLMEKMPKGFKPVFGDWKYVMYLPDGSFIGETNGDGDENVEYCGACHAGVGATQDHMFFLPKPYRVK
jgi:hypothetical protein